MFFFFLLHTQILNSSLAHYFAALGNALLEFVSGTHSIHASTVTSPAYWSQMHAASSPDLRSLAGTGAQMWWQYQQLRCDTDIPPLSERRADVNYRSQKTEAGIVAAASLQDGKININFDFLVRCDAHGRMCPGAHGSSNCAGCSSQSARVYFFILCVYTIRYTIDC